VHRVTEASNESYAEPDDLPDNNQHSGVPCETDSPRKEVLAHREPLFLAAFCAFVDDETRSGLEPT
jgi:hypothetical protein